MNNYEYQDFLSQTPNGFMNAFMQEDYTTLPFYNGVMNNQNNMNGINKENTNNNAMLYSEKEGYTKGNMYKNLYDPFMNYRPREIVARNDQEKLMLDLSEAGFAMHEANLYLDNYPNDNYMITKFNEYKNRYNTLLNDYQQKYGPIEINSPYVTKVPFAWSTTNWPWDRRNF